MVFFVKRSLSEDSIDRYNHTWAFLYLLALTLITLFLPLSPSLVKSRGVASSAGGNAQGGNGGSPTFSADCWVPVDFTMPMSQYAHRICSSAYNSIVQGRNSSSASLIVRDDRPIPISGSDGQFPEKMLFVSEESQEARERRKRYEDKFSDLYSFMTPLFMFVLVIFMRLPHAIWSLLSTCFGGINVDRTLAAAQNAQKLDSDGQQRVYKEIAATFDSRSRRATGLLYLFMKVLMVVLAGLGISAATMDFLDGTDELKDILSIEKTLYDNNTNARMSYLSRQSGNVSVVNLYDYPEVLFCNFEITQLQNVQSYIVQCFFTPEVGSHADGSGSSGGPGAQADWPVFGDDNRSDTTAMSEDQILSMYEGIFTSVLAVFIILVIIDFGSLVAWFLTLFSPCHRSKMGLDADATIDFVFLVAMARLNTSCHVASELAKYSRRGNDRKPERETNRL